jgi:hypothetical protein
MFRPGANERERAVPPQPLGTDLRGSTERDARERASYTEAESLGLVAGALNLPSTFAAAKT